MAEAAPEAMRAERRRGRGVARVLSFAVLAVLLLAGLGYGALRWLDTDSGRAFVVRQLPLYAPKSGMTVRAGRIEGSIFGSAIVHDLVIGDPNGDFAVIPVVALDWRPLDLIENRLTARSLTAAEVRILRKPALRPTGDDRILPDIDIVIDRLKIDRLVLEAPVVGKRHLIGIGGSADIRSGRARIALTALTLADGDGAASGDAVRLKLDSEPDRNQFDVDAFVTAPKGGVITALLGLSDPLDLRLAGDGSWQVWQGKLLATLAGAPFADLAVTARSGVFGVKGSAAPARLLRGAAARLLGPRLTIDANAQVADRHVDLTARLASPALTVAARGGLDFRDERIDDASIDARLLDPGAINAKASGRDVRLLARVAGRFTDPLIDYRLSAASAGWGHTLASDVRIAGIVRGAGRPLVVPVNALATRITGVGETAGALLTNVRITGPLTISGGKLISNALVVQTDRLRGSATEIAVLGADDYLVTTKLTLARYALDGVGVADIGADLRIVPAPGGSRITGRTTVAIPRFDSSLFARLAQGTAAITADIDVAGDMSLAFRNARLVSPGLTLAADGTRSPDGLVQLKGSGTSADYGPLTLALAGPIDAPVVDLVLAKPGLGLGLADITGRVAPAAGGWRFEAAGTSSYGPVSTSGTIRSDDGPLGITFARVAVAGLAASGSVTQTAAGPFAGRIEISGPGLTGAATLGALGNRQHADVVITAKAARLSFDTPVAIDSGSLKLAATLPDGGIGTEAGTSITAAVNLAGVERGGTRIDTTSASINLSGGRGTAKFAASGNTDIPFAVSSDIDVAPDRIAVKAAGRLDDKPIGLAGAAVLSHGAAGWSLAPVKIVTPDGSAEISGQYGTRRAIHADLDHLALSLLAVAYPGLDFSGRVTGQIDLALGSDGLPVGRASLRVNSLSRAGLAAASTPIDVGLNADMTAAGATARAVIVRGGTVEGRAQAHLGPIAAGDSIAARLFASPVRGQLRYNGPAQALWGLAGLEGIDVRGPIAIVADVSGPLGDPHLAGTLRSEGARVESTVLGAVIDQASLDSHFTESRLELTHFDGRVGKDGSISGSGGIDLSAERGFPIDVRLQLKNAQLLNRDDLTGSATGSVRIATDQYGGVVSGKLTIDKATLRVGRTSVADVPVLPVSEINARAVGRRAATYAPPTRWLLNLEVKGDRRIFVNGLGITSEWRAALTVKGGATTPELFGKVELVRGDYDFAGKRFTLTKGDLRFAGAYPPDPLIDVSATSSNAGFTAQLDITGTAQRPEIKFSSTPSLPEDEVLSRVLFGTSVTGLSAPEAVQLAAALASLRPSNGKSLNPLNLVKKGLGIDRLRILPADTTTGRKTALAAGHYIGRSVYVELATDAQGYTATNIEVSLTRSLSILSEVATLGGTSASLKWKRDY